MGERGHPQGRIRWGDGRARLESPIGAQSASFLGRTRPPTSTSQSLAPWSGIDKTVRTAGGGREPGHTGLYISAHRPQKTSEVGTACWAGVRMSAFATLPSPTCHAAHVGVHRTRGTRLDKLCEVAVLLALAANDASLSAVCNECPRRHPRQLGRARKRRRSGCGARRHCDGRRELE